MMGQVGIVLSCEHAGNDVPQIFAASFRASKQTLGSHRGYDPGAHALAQAYAATLGVRLYAQSVSRLLIDCNRSLDSPTLFSPFSPLTPEARQRLINEHYQPYRDAVRAEVERLLTTNVRVVHLSVHSFTPEMRGKVRATDIGLLFDPTHAFEAAVCEKWRSHLLSTRTEFVVHDNEPYRGDGDGLTTTLRHTFPKDRYAGIELEVNQKYPRRHPVRWNALQMLVTTTFATAVRQIG